jgi:glycosyltransferase involved in cell wall biosynthesis
VATTSARRSPTGVRIGIDATNIRVGGGVTYLVGLLSHARPEECGVQRITVWGPASTLALLPQRHWLSLKNHPWQDGPLPMRVAWQRLHLTRSAENEADVLLVPGGSYSGPFRPFVTMAQSLLPFDPEARSLFPLGWIRARNWVLSHEHAGTFKRANGAIFLTQFGRELAERELGVLGGATAVIPLGPSPNVRRARPAKRDGEFAWVYLSMLDMYKHHDAVAEAAAMLRRKGHALRVDFIGPAYEPALRQLERVVRRLAPADRVVRWLGPVPLQDVASVFDNYHGAVFASSCESWGFPLLDGLRSGLPTACSELSTLPEVASDAAVYFDPRQPRSIADAMERIMTDDSLRARLSERGPEVTARFDWAIAAEQTLRFLVEVAHSQVGR